MKSKIRNRYLVKTIEMFRSLSQVNVPAFAGNASFFIMLSAVPMVMLLLNILSYTNMGNGVILEVLDDALPAALYPTVEALLLAMAQGSSSTLVSVTALTALWASSRGVHGILVGLNRIYGVQEDRGYFYTRALSLVYTFLMLLVLLLTLGLYVFHRNIMQWLSQSSGSLLRLLAGLLSNRFLFLLLIQMMTFAAMFMFMPNRRNSFWSSLPGAAFSALGWQLFSFFFSIYATDFQNLASIYGSLTTMALAMVWLYTCIAIIFYGGALNKYLMDIGYALHRSSGGKSGEKSEERDQQCQ